MVGYPMRRLGGLLALAYGLSFLAACLGGCLAPDPAGHGCCRSEGGLTAGGASTDCCMVVPGVSATSFEAAAPTSATISAAADLVPLSGPPPAPSLAPPPASVRPPLILRV